MSFDKDTQPWQDLAETALTLSDDKEKGFSADLITTGITTATKAAGGVAAAGAAVGAVLLNVLNPFKDQPLLGIAVGIMIAAAILGIAWFVSFDLRARAQVTAARFAALSTLAKQEEAAGAQASTSPPDASGDAPSAVSPVNNFDVRIGANVYSLIAVGWSPAADTASAGSKLMYLVADNPTGGLSWRNQGDIDGVLRSTKTSKRQGG